MIVTIKTAMLIAFIGGSMTGWWLCEWYCTHKTANGIKRIMGKLSPCARAEILDAVAPTQPKPVKIGDQTEGTTP
ncbi:MAG: hypothetical protein PHR35_04125 [Kiritimatiellae bacterium]|nr:hypothetical protein [Kiritimatiellia bacterium]